MSYWKCKHCETSLSFSEVSKSGGHDCREDALIEVDAEYLAALEGVSVAAEALNSVGKVGDWEPLDKALKRLKYRSKL